MTSLRKLVSSVPTVSSSDWRTSDHERMDYGLLGGPIALLSHAIMIALVGVTVYWESGRRFGIDRWLHERWPALPIW